jgi:hypothetical protein
MSGEVNEFSACESLAEIFLVVFHLAGLPGVAHVLTKSESTREALRDAADMFQRVGMKPVAEVLRAVARKAKRARPTLGPGYQTRSALIIVARKRAEAKPVT